MNSPLNLDLVQKAQEEVGRVRQEVARSFMGPAAVIDVLLVALLAKGHVLLEGVPGVAKTTLIKAFSASLGCELRRIQFTPDLLPQDITGTYILHPQSGQFQLRKGPVFAHVVLADELNRAPARTQSALLEAMQERQVSIEGEQLALPSPFLVLATQNPLDLEGTFPLPEAQIDRFLVQIELGYPSAGQEVSMLRTHGLGTPAPTAVLDAERCRELQQLAAQVHVEEDLLGYATALTRYTRQHPRVVLGCSPRATLSLLQAARARALLAGRPYATPDDFKAVAPFVLAHRLILVPELEDEPTARGTIIAETLERVPFEHPRNS